MSIRPVGSTQHARSVRRGSVRTAGLVVAALLGTVSIAIVTYFLVTGGGRSGRSRTTLLPNDGVVLPPEVIQPAVISARPGVPSLSGGKGIEAQIASRSDPTRIAGRILSASLDPLEGGRYLAELPQSYLYMKDGRTIYIRSDTAKFLFPHGPSGQPDSGVLEGHVVINIFDRRTDGAAADVERDTPSLNITTSTLTFDMTTGQFTGPDRFVVTGPTVDFAGTGLNVLYNQKDERLELLTIAKSETLKLRPKPQGPAEPSTGPAAANPNAANPPPTPAPERPSPPGPIDRLPATEAFYHATFNDAVRVRQGERAIDSDALQLWIRLLDNQLSPNAIAQSGPAKHAGPPQAREPHGPIARELSPSSERALADSHPSSTPPEPGTLASGRDEVVLNWSGPLEVRPLNERPASLNVNEVAARFSSKPDSSVAFKDGVSRADGAASTLDYAATTRDITMTALEPRGVRLTMPNAGEVLAQKLAVNLSTGVASVSGGGELRGTGKGTGLSLVGGTEVVGPLLPVEAAGPVTPSSGPESLTPSTLTPSSTTRPLSTRRVVWSDQADFLFATADGTMTGALLSATLAGAVHGTDGRASLTSGWLQAEFVPFTNAVSGPSTRSRPGTTLSRLRAEEQVVASDGRGGGVGADRLDVAFQPRSGAPHLSDPVLLTLAGRAGASREGSTLEADLIEARLGRSIHDPRETGSSSDDTSEVRDVLARGDVHFVRSDGVWADGHELRATLATQVADLLGEGAALGKDNHRIEGSQIRLDGLSRSLEVFGPGTFRLGAPRNFRTDVIDFGPTAPEFGPDGDARPDFPRPEANGTATWTLGMTYDDRSGFVECRGGVSAELNPDPLSQRRLTGERLHLELSPGSGSSQAASDPIHTATMSESRTLLRAVIFGSEDGRSGGGRASVQSATYEPGPAPSDPRRMIGLQYLEGDTIRADDVLGTLTVPTAGRMLVVDRRRVDVSPSEPGSSGPTVSGLLPEGREAPSALMPASARGDTLFTWQGGLVADRHANSAVINGAVRITQQPAHDGTPLELESEEVVAYIADANRTPTTPRADVQESSSTLSGSQLRVRLTRAVARGAVWARSGGKELTADLLDYDAVNRLFRATGSDNNDVVLFDPAKPTPITAKLLEWDLARDRVEVRKPGTVVVPADTLKAR